MSGPYSYRSGVGIVNDDELAQEYVDQAKVLWAQYQDTGEEKLLHEVVGLLREALQFRPAGHPNRHVSCADLASSLKTLYDHSGDEALLTEWIDLEREVLRLRPAGHPDRHYSCNNLASSLRTLYTRMGDETLLTECIDLHREALTLRPAGHPDRHLSCSNLAVSLRTLYNRLGDITLLTELINLEREALRLRPAGHPYRDVSCAHLASSLWTLYNRSGDENLLTECINLHREGLRLRPAGHPHRPYSCASLALLLHTLYNQSGDDILLTECIDLEREAVKLCPVGSPDRDTSCNNLATSLWTLYNRSEDESLLTECIDLHREALKLRPAGHPHRHYSCNNLAGSLQTLYNRSGDESLLTLAIELYHDGVASASAHEKWCSSIQLSDLYLIKGNGHHSVDLAIQYLSQSVQHEPSDITAAVSLALGTLDQIWKQAQDDLSNISSALVPIYERIVTFLPLLASPVFDLASQFQRLQIVSRVGADACVNAALAGHWRAGFEHLEVAQGTIWQQRLHLRDPSFHAVPNTLKVKLEKCLQQLSRCKTVALVNQPSLSRDELHRYTSQMYAVVHQIRTVPGLERFMLGESYETLCSVAAHNSVVVLVGARGHFYAFIIHHGKICGDGPLRLQITKDILDMTSIHGNLSYHRGAPGSDTKEDRDRGIQIRGQSTPLNRYLQSLWLVVVKPILVVLQLQSSLSSSRPRVHWCPTGPFTTMPLHAAGIYGERESRRECCADYVVSSYTPTLTTLLRAQRSIIPFVKTDLALLLVAEKQAHEVLAPIPEVDLEIKDIAAIATANDVKIVDCVVGSTSVAQTSEAVQAANMVHLACHGVQDHTDATKSGFCLGDGRLTISELTEIDIRKGFLAFLSACETARGSDTQPDQAMHLAAAMLFVGFKSVIATLWAISDEDGPKVAKWFYKELFSNEVIDADRIACALDSAVGKLRRSGVPSYRWVPFIHMGA